MGVVVPLRERGSVRAKTEKLTFTEQRLAKLRKPASGTRYVFDTEEPGLCIRLTPGAASYVFYKWHDGKPGR